MDSIHPTFEFFSSFYKTLKSFLTMWPEEGTSEKKQRPQKRVFGNRGGKSRSQSKVKVEKQNTPLESAFVGEEEEVRSTSSQSTSSPAQRFDSNPSFLTPKRRRSQHSTPSSSPCSKLDLSRDIFDRLSPKKAKLDRNSKSPGDFNKMHRSQFLLADEKEDDEVHEDDELRSGPYEGKFVSRPSRLAYASRMAPKKLRKEVERSSPCPDPSATANDWQSRTNSQSTEGTIDTGVGIVPMNKLLTQDAFDIASFSNKSLERWSQKTEDFENTANRATLESEWKNLEEMDEEDVVEGRNDIRSILNLRASGTNLRSTAEIDDLLDGLAIKNRLGARKATCVELIKILMGVPDEGNIPIDWVPTPISSTGFITAVRRTNMTAILVQALQEAGAGEEKDCTFDLAIGLAYMRLFEGKMLEEVLVSCPQFLVKVMQILSATYQQPSAHDKHHILLQKLANRLQKFKLSDETIQPDRVILQAVVMMLSVDSKGTSTPPISHNSLGEVRMLQIMLWKRLFELSEAIELQGNCQIAGKCLSIRQICLVLSLLRARYSNLLSMEEEQIGELLRLNHTLVKHIGCEDNDVSRASAEAIQSCLQFQVTITNQDQSENCKMMLRISEKTVSHLVHIIVKSNEVARDMYNSDDVHNIRLLDLAALALGILTDLLQKEADQSIHQLMSDMEVKSNAIFQLTYLFSDISQQNDNKHSILFSGCLAFFLSLLIVKADDVEGNIDDQTIIKIMQNAISEGISINTKLTESLDRFSSLAKEESIFFRSHTQDQAQQSAHKEEHFLIRQLSDRLRSFKEQGKVCH